MENDEQSNNTMVCVRK